MFDDPSLWSVLTLARLTLFVVAVLALAAWAKRQPDQQSALIERLTANSKKSPETSCGASQSRETQ